MQSFSCTIMQGMQSCDLILKVRGAEDDDEEDEDDDELGMGDDDDVDEDEDEDEDEEEEDAAAAPAVLVVGWRTPSDATSCDGCCKPIAYLLQLLYTACGRMLSRVSS